MNATRIVRDAATGLVALVAAVVSYRHQAEVALSVGEDRTVALILPLSVDGLLAAASVVMVSDRKAGARARMSAKVSFVLGVAASVAANVAAAEPTVGARLVASWPAVALLACVEMLSRTPVMSADTATVKTRPTPNGRARTSRRTTAADRLAKARASRPDMSVPELAKAARVSERHARRLLAGQEA